jgi:plastocyanin
MPPLLPKRISSTPARRPRSRPAIVDRIKPTPGSPATKSAKQQPNGSSDIIEWTTAKKIKAPRNPHAVTVIHACRDHQRCSADPGLGFMARLDANRDSHIGASAQSSLGGYLRTRHRTRPQLSSAGPISGGRMRKLVFVLVAVWALGLTACSSDDGGGTTSGETGTTGTTENGDCADLTGEGATFTITISDFAFDPNCFTASASQGISIVNQDAVDHTFTITGTDIDVPIAAGQTFNGEPISGAVSPGTYDFLCTLHPSMTGQVTIVV